MIYELTAITYNPLGMFHREVCEWFWQGKQLQDTHQDNLNLSSYT